MCEQLKAHGYEGLENHLNEWNPYHREFGTAHQGAEIAAMMLGMQNRSPDILCIYDMKATGSSGYAPLFNTHTQKPQHGYYALAAFNRLYQLANQAELSCDTDGLYAVAATNGQRHALMISNLTGETQTLFLDGVDLTDARVYTIDDGRLLSWTPDAKKIENNSVMLIEW